MRRAGLWLVLVVAACASYRPQPIESVPFKERAQTQTLGKVTVTAVVLSDEESHAVFGVNLIPHTQQMTTLGKLSPGSVVNVEIDMLARYVARLLENK